MARRNHVGAPKGAYGARLGEAFRLQDPPTLVSKTLRKSRLAATRFVNAHPNHGITAPIPPEDAYLVTVQPRDPVMLHLTLALLSAIESPENASSLFVDYLALAFRAHVAHAYGGVARRAPSARSRGGLAPWQERRAKEIIMAELEQDVSLDRLAAECQLSRTHFARAFRQTTGMPPHRWLLARRVDKAKELLRLSQIRLADIALACGFADQSHFTKVFTRMVGTSPGAWRRAHQTGKASPMRPGPPDPTDGMHQYLIAHGLRKWAGGG